MLHVTSERASSWAIIPAPSLILAAKSVLLVWCMSVYVCLSVCLSVCRPCAFVVCVCVYVYSCVCVNTLCTCTHADTHTCTRACVTLCPCVCVCVCVCVWMCMGVCVCTSVLTSEVYAPEQMIHNKKMMYEVKIHILSKKLFTRRDLCVFYPQSSQ